MDVADRGAEAAQEVTSYDEVSESEAASPIERAILLILSALEADHSVGATLLPGYIISRVPMSPAERARRYLPRANEKRLKDNQERLRRLKNEIARQIAKDPSISDYDLAIVLNEAGLRTYTGLKYTATRVEELRRRLRRAALA
jgi:hypothetical protein